MGPICDLAVRREALVDLSGVRSKDEASLRREKDGLLAECWSVHAAV